MVYYLKWVGFLLTSLKSISFILPVTPVYLSWYPTFNHSWTLKTISFFNIHNFDQGPNRDKGRRKSSTSLKKRMILRTLTNITKDGVLEMFSRSKWTLSKWGSGNE